MRSHGVITAFGKLNNHRGTPRIASEKPVTQSSLHTGIGCIPRCRAVQVCLCNSRSNQVVGTPHKRDSVQKSTIRGTPTQVFQSLAHVAGIFSRYGRVFCNSQVIVSQVHKRIKLIMTCPAQLQPGSHFFQLSPVIGFFKPIGVTGQMKKCSGGQFHIVHVVILFVEIGRHHTTCLSISRFFFCKSIGRHGLSLHGSRKSRIDISEKFGSQCKGRGKFTGRGSHACSAVDVRT